MHQAHHAISACSRPCTAVRTLNNLDHIWLFFWCLDTYTEMQLTPTVNRALCEEANWKHKYEKLAENTRQLDTRWSINNNCRKIKHTMCGCWQCETITSTVVNIDNRCGHAHYSTCLIKLCHCFKQRGNNARWLTCFNVGACSCAQSGLVHSSHSSEEVTVLKLSKKERHLCILFDGHFHLLCRVCHAHIPTCSLDHSPTHLGLISEDAMQDAVTLRKHSIRHCTVWHCWLSTERHVATHSSWSMGPGSWPLCSL